MCSSLLLWATRHRLVAEVEQWRNARCPHALPSFRAKPFAYKTLSETSIRSCIAHESAYYSACIFQKSKTTAYSKIILLFIVSHISHECRIPNHRPRCHAEPTPSAYAGLNATKNASACMTSQSFASASPMISLLAMSKNGKGEEMSFSPSLRPAPISSSPFSSSVPSLSW